MKMHLIFSITTPQFSSVLATVTIPTILHFTSPSPSALTPLFKLFHNQAKIQENFWNYYLYSKKKYKVLASNEFNKAYFYNIEKQRSNWIK